VKVTPKTFHLILQLDNGEEIHYDTMDSLADPKERAFPTRADARKEGRKLQRKLPRVERFRIDAHKIERKRRNGTQHMSVAAPSLLQSPRYTTLYRNTDLLTEVCVTSVDEPADERRFKVVGHGKPVFKAVSITALTPPKGGRMARTKKSAKKSNKKKQAAPEADAEDEALVDDEELEDLDDLESVEDSEEPDDEDSDDEDDEDELAGLGKKELRKRAKAAGIKGFSKLKTEELRDALREEDEEEEDEEDEDESDEFEDMDRSELKAAMKEAGLGKAKKSQSDDDLRQLLRDDSEEEDDEEDDDEEEDEVAATKTKKGSKSKSKSKRQAPPQRELPKGKVGVDAVAKEAGVDARAVRVFLRGEDNTDQYKVEGRWAFTSKQATQLGKRIKKARR
jgi:hypothetical protein